MSMKFNLEKANCPFPRVKKKSLSDRSSQAQLLSRESALQTHPPTKFTKPTRWVYIPSSPSIPAWAPSSLGAIPGFLPLLSLGSFRKH